MVGEKPQKKAMIVMYNRRCDKELLNYIYIVKLSVVSRHTCIMHHYID